MAVAGDSQRGRGQLLVVGGAAGGWGASKGMRQYGCIIIVQDACSQGVV